MTRMPSPRPTMSRRDFLQLLAAAGTTAAVGHILYTYAPWLDYDKQVDQAWDTPFQKESTMSAQMRELIRYATLAANGHNSQPWKFAIQGTTIQIHPDNARRLAVVDPHDRELWISLGCALENVVIAAHAAGYASEITYPTPDADYLNIGLRQTRAINADPLFDAIPARQNTRSSYDGHPVPIADLRKIESVPLGSGISSQVITGIEKRETILEYIKTGDQRQYGNQAFIDELVSWIRFNKPEAFKGLDGLYTRCSGNPEIPRWLGKLFVTTSSAGQQAQTDEKNVRSSSGLLVIVSEQDNQRAWIDTGRVYERLALTLTTLHIKSALLNQPMEVAELRAEFQRYLNIGTARPQLLLRFGYANPMPHALRRSVEQVLM